MPRAKKTTKEETFKKTVSQSSAVDFSINNDVERFKFSEIGFQGLKIKNGVSEREIKKELKWPERLKTYDEMANNALVNGSLNLYRTILNKSDWAIKPHKDSLKIDLDRAEIVRQMLFEDMEQSFSVLLDDAFSAWKYGFALNEIVLRRRYKVNGSRFNDGYIAPKKLPLRHQESIKQFIYDESNSDIIGVKQNVSESTNSANRLLASDKNNEVNIPIRKLLHFVVNSRGDPFGVPPTRDAYLSWKYLKYIEELEATGLSKDVSGTPVLKIPANYLSANATPEEKKIADYYYQTLQNLQANEQSAVLLPRVIDPESKMDLFEIDLISIDGKKNYSTEKIKEYYKTLIVIAMSSDILVMGTSATGSFALGALKSSLTGAYCHSIAKNICETINRQLIRLIYELNGWETEKMCSLDFSLANEIDLDSLSKFLQRTASTSLLEVDRELLNIVRAAVGADPKPVDEPVDKENLSMFSSNAGEGMQTAGEGTATSVSGKDTTSSNLENAA